MRRAGMPVIAKRTAKLRFEFVAAIARQRAVEIGQEAQHGLEFGERDERRMSRRQGGAQAQHQARDDTERAFAADEKVLQVVA